MVTSRSRSIGRRMPATWLTSRCTSAATSDAFAAVLHAIPGLPLTSTTSVTSMGTDVASTLSICCRTPLSVSTKSAAVSPFTTALPSRTETSTMTTSVPARNVCWAAPAPRARPRRLRSSARRGMGGAPSLQDLRTQFADEQRPEPVVGVNILAPWIDGPWIRLEHRRRQLLRFGAAPVLEQQRRQRQRGRLRAGPGGRRRRGTRPAPRRCAAALGNPARKILRQVDDVPIAGQRLCAIEVLERVLPCGPSARA